MTNFISVADPVALAREILEEQIFPLIERRRPNNIPYVVVGPNLPNASFTIIREACITLGYSASCRQVGRLDAFWLIDLDYHSSDFAIAS